MRNLFLSFLIISTLLVQAQNQDADAIRFSKTITAADLKKHLSILASDEYEGRETGQKGQKMAAEYIKNHFIACGIPAHKALDKGYFQTYPLTVFNPQTMKLKIGDIEFIQNKDFFPIRSVLNDTTIVISEVVFAGYGISSDLYDDYKTANVKAKNTMVLEGEPFSEDGTKSLVTGNLSTSDWTTNFRFKTNEAQERGVSIMFIVDKNMEKSLRKFDHRINSKSMTVGKPAREKNTIVIHITEKMANEIFASASTNVQDQIKSISKTGASNSISCKKTITIGIQQKFEELTAENVCGYVEGSDLKEELIVITGHYDHLGIHGGKVYNGADDDGSGTVSVMEMAEAFATAKKEGKGPRRSMLFMTVSGEEKGLLGSEYYTDHPVFPLANTVCDLNIDMIGRIDDAHKGNADYIYLIGADMLSQDLHKISEEANTKYTKLALDYTYNMESDPNRYYYRSDHYNFARYNVPVIFYFNGVHEDYHEETDEVAKINFDKMEKISRLVFFTAWELANRTERIKLSPRN